MISPSYNRRLYFQLYYFQEILFLQWRGSLCPKAEAKGMAACWTCKFFDKKKFLYEPSFRRLDNCKKFSGMAYRYTSQLENKIAEHGTGAACAPVIFDDIDQPEE